MNCPCCRLTLLADQAKRDMLAHPTGGDCPLAGEYRHVSGWEQYRAIVRFIVRRYARGVLAVAS